MSGEEAPALKKSRFSWKHVALFFVTLVVPPIMSAALLLNPDLVSDPEFTTAVLDEVIKFENTLPQDNNDDLSM